MLAQLPDRKSASEELNQGASDYRAARYADATTHFENAVRLAPSSQIAHLYLATAYAQQYIPGVDAPENLELATKAIAEYSAVLELNPRDHNSVQGIAYLYLMQKKFDEAARYYQRALDLDPANPELYYGLGYIDWTVAYAFRQDLRTRWGMNPIDSAIGQPFCEQLRVNNWERIRHGIEMMTKALQQRPDYDDAMAYLNLLYRERADMQCGNPAAAQADEEAADAWVDKTIETKRKAKPDAKQPID
jgi:tetratricopeptide (TPR) repeat protein